MPKIVTQKQPSKHNPLDDFPIVDDEKLRISLSTQADKWNEFARQMIYNTYNDVELLGIFKGMRDSGIYQHGDSTKTKREVVRFPNGYVYEFCKAVFHPIYGSQWAVNPKVWRHELIRPWLLIELK